MDENNVTQDSFNEFVESIGEDGVAGSPITAPAEPTEPEAEKQPEAEEPKQEHTKEEKEAYAWGKMNAENNALREMLKKVADANGIKYTNNSDLLQAMNDDAIAKMAEKQNVPVELLRKIESLEADAMAWRQAQQKNAAAYGFQQLKDTYGLEQKQLEEFAIELANDGLDPFKNRVDIVKEYKSRHFDELVEARIKVAVEAALKRDEAVSSQSSTPAAHQGGADDSGGDASITTLAQLDALLAGLK